MESKSLEGMRVAILATDDFEESELFEPRQALDNAGAKTTVVAPKAGKIQAMKHDEKTIKIGVDRTLDEAGADDFDAVLLPGRRAERRCSPRDGTGAGICSQHR
jgi:deglycase